MKKFTLVIAMLSVFCLSANCEPNVFDSLENLSEAQKYQISNIQNVFKIKNNELEMQISTYTDKIARLKSNTDKTQEQIMLIIGTYEKNIETLKSQQDKLVEETDLLYKNILTDNQYKQYQAMQLNVKNSFAKFLEK